MGRALPGRVALLLLVLWAKLPESLAVWQSSTFEMGGLAEDMRWRYLTKFGFGLGIGSYKYRFRTEGTPAAGDANVYLSEVDGLSQNVSLTFESYLDEDWPGDESIKHSCSRTEKKHRPAEVSIAPTGEWTKWFSSSIRHNVRSHVWYYAVSDCKGSLPPGQKVTFEWEALQADSSHFSGEQRWNLLSNVLTMLCLAVFAVSFVKRCRDFAQSAGVVHSAIWALAGVVVLQFAAQALHTVHLLEYRSNGRGLWPAELLSEVLCVVAQMVQTTLLNLIGMGYTIEDSAKLNWPKVATLIISSLGLHLALVFLSKLEAGAADNFHQHDGMAGWAMLALRLLLYAFFLHAVHGTGRNGGFRLQSFLGQFRLAGALYFLGYPFLFLVSLPLAPYLRPILLTGGILTSQILSNLWLSSLFLSRGEYFKVSELNSSLLPGGTPRSGRNNKSD